MAAFTTITAVGGLVLGAAAKGFDAITRRNENKKQAKALAARDAAARTAARERNLLDDARDDTGADIALGKDSTAAEAATTSQAGEGASTSRSGSVTSRVGGVRKRKPVGLMKSASKSIGL